MQQQPKLVWYISYASNMSLERFLCYIRGGRAKGSIREHSGCSDQQLPRKIKPLLLSQSLYFADESQAWSGGIAFIGHTPGKEQTLARAYLITKQQFEEVVAQESWRNESAPIDFAKLAEHGQLVVGDGLGKYDKVIYCGEMDGYPAASFTGPLEHDIYTKPVAAYLAMVGAGLRETHRLSNRQAATYLSTKPGITAHYGLDELSAIIGS